MKRLPPIALAAALSLCAAGCKPKPEEHPEPQDAIRELDAAEAAESFAEKIESRLDGSELAGSASSAFVKKVAGGDGVQIAYVFRGKGGPMGVDPFLQKLESKWPPTTNRDCWMPWTRFKGYENSLPGPFMGAYLHEEFKLTLWIDPQGQDLFVCYTEPAPRLPPRSKENGVSNEQGGLRGSFQRGAQRDGEENKQ